MSDATRSSTGRLHADRGRGLLVAVLASVLFGGILALYSVSVPLYEAPDEPAHVDLVMNAATGSRMPDYDDRLWSAAVVADCRAHVTTTRWCPPVDGSAVDVPRTHTRDDAPERRGGPGFEELGGNVQVGPTNQLAQHPPLYYEALGALVRVERHLTGRDWSLASEVALLRLVNAVLMAPLPLLAWWTARRIGSGPLLAATASLLPLVVPQLSHIGSTVNNDNLLVVASALVLGACAGVVRGDDRLRTAVVVGLATGAALLTKSSAVFLLPVVGASYLVTPIRRWRDPARDRSAPASALRSSAPLGIALGIALALAGWWYVANQVRHGRFVPSVEDERIDESMRPPGFSPSPRVWADTFLTFMVPRFWGWFGWYSVRTNRVLAQVSSWATALLALGAVAVRRGRPVGSTAGPAGTPSRRYLGALLVPGALLLAGVVWRGWNLYVVSGHFPFLQGRYLFPALTTTAVVVAAGLQKLVGRWAPAVVLGWATIMQADALQRLLAGYWGGPGADRAEQVGALLAWTRWPPASVVAVAATSALVAAALGVAVVALAAAGRPSSEGPRGPQRRTVALSRR